MSKRVLSDCWQTDVDGAHSLFVPQKIIPCTSSHRWLLLNLLFCLLVTDECMFTLDTCFWNNAPNNKLQWQLKRSLGMVSGNVLVANISYLMTPSADKDGANLIGRIIGESDNICSLRISYWYALSRSVLQLMQSFVRLSTIASLPLSRRLIRYTLETTLPQLHASGISSYLNVRAIWNSSELGEFFIHSLQYLLCHCKSNSCNIRDSLVSCSISYSDTTFESSTDWSDVSPFNSNWSLVHVPNNSTSSAMPPVDHTYGGLQLGRYFLATGGQSSYAVAAVDDIPWKDVCGLRLWYYVSQGLPQLDVVVVFNATATSNSSVAVSVRTSGVTAEWTLLEMARGSELYGSRIELNASSTDGAPFSVGVDDVEFTECPGKPDSVL